MYWQNVYGRFVQPVIHQVKQSSRVKVCCKTCLKSLPIVINASIYSIKDCKEIQVDQSYAVVQTDILGRDYHPKRQPSLSNLPGQEQQYWKSYRKADVSKACLKLQSKWMNCSTTHFQRQILAPYQPSHLQSELFGKAEDNFFKQKLNAIWHLANIWGLGII